MQTLEATCYGQYCVHCDALMEWQVVERKGVSYCGAKCCGQSYLFVNSDNSPRLAETCRQPSTTLVAFGAFLCILLMPFMIFGRD
jgi:hypothetical protein